MQADLFVSPKLSPNSSEGSRVILGEGPVVLGDRLLTTDARRSLIRSTDLSSGQTEDIDLAAILRDSDLIPREAPNPVLGSLGPTRDGKLLTALATGIYLFDPAKRSMTELTHPEAERHAERPHYNDGKIGPDGAFYVGGMIGGREGAGRLLRIAPDGSFTEPQRGNPPLTTPNGLHWFATDSPDVWDFYYVCSQYPAIQRYRHTLSTGEMVREADLISLPRDTFGYLDGMAGTSNGLLILALYLPVEYGCIVVDTRTGSIVERISTGVPQTTSVALRGGEIYITTAAQEYGDAEFAQFPNAGGIFRCFAQDAESELLRAAREDTVASGFRFESRSPSG